MLLLALIGLSAAIPWALPHMQVARDFAAFWTAARLALDGKAGLAYGEAGSAALAGLFGPSTYPPFFYPPTALLLWLPFGLLGFAAAAALWVAASLGLYGWALRAMRPGQSLLPALAFPAVTFCALYGQNGLFSAALLGGATVLLEASPVLAGMLLGVLAYKPQMAVLVPLALLLAGQRRALIASGLTAAAFVAVSVLAFGADAWRGFWAVLPMARRWNAEGMPGFQTFVSPYAAMRMLGLGVQAGEIAQAGLALVGVGCLVVIIRRGGDAASQMAVLVAATLLWVPFLGQYDLVIAAVPACWLARKAQASGWLRHERGALALLFVSPIAIVAGGAHAIPLGPAALLAMLALVTRRALHHTRAQEPVGM